MANEAPMDAREAAYRIINAGGVESLSHKDVARQLTAAGLRCQRPVSMWEAGNGITWRVPTAADVAACQRRTWGYFDRAIAAAGGAS